MAGFGATHRLRAEGLRPVVYDKASCFGGHTASFLDPKGFTFDLGPHISFTKDPRIQALFAKTVDDQYEALQVKLDNIWRGRRLTHPVQLHLNGLPHDLIVEIIADFVKVHDAEQRPIENYEDWLVASYGRRFAELFPMQYTRKYHMTTASNMSTDWLGPRMYRPSIEELLRGALAPWNPEVHYITTFRYPKRGGFMPVLSRYRK
jgi:protoporphyrinogen oxidase